MTIYVLPANVSLPQFSKDLYDVTIPESLPPQSFVVMATAVYVTEESVSYPLRYSIMNGNDGGKSQTCSQRVKSESDIYYILQQKNKMY